MTDPGTEPATYLEEAATELRKARDANEKRRELASMLAGGEREDVLREVADRSLEIGGRFIALAAIKAGLPPCCCRHARPGQEGQDHA